MQSYKYLEVDCHALAEACLHQLYRIVRVPVENVEVADAVLARMQSVR